MTYFKETIATSCYKLSSFCNTKMFNTLDKKYFKYVSYKDSKELISNFKSVYRSVNE
ncbi:hypothetical protein [Clostridioides difficile]|uniref:hypothetical protein n=1 Tax=Clostridioides difficile TaxID=1496 RepID=UPI003F8D46A2